MSIRDMGDEDFLAQFRDGTLDLTSFGHEEHLRIGFVCLEKFGLWAGTDMARKALIGLATEAGVPEKYHETVTAAYMMIINERRHRQPENREWDRFLAANPDLLDRDLLEKYYSPEMLNSREARDVFVLPRVSAA